MSTVELYEGARGRWRWAYRETSEGGTLPSNEDYATSGEARAAAAAAYPGVPIAQQTPDRPPARSKTRTGKLAGWLTPVVVLIAWSRNRRR